MAVKTAPGPIKVVWKRPALYPAQQRAIIDAPDMFGNPARYSWIEASTKAGKTHGCIVWLLEQAFLTGKEGRNYWWVAPVYGQAKIAYSRMKLALPKPIRDASGKIVFKFFESNDQNLTITLLPSKAVLWFKSAEKPDNLYGEDVYAAVLDEASRMREASWIAVRSTVTATKGPIRVIGNVKGRRNWFFLNARKAEAGLANHHYSKLTAYDAIAGGVLDKEEIEDAKSLLSEEVFRELYMADGSDDEGNPFGLKHIAACIGPLSSEPTVVAGVDVAKSRDWTVIIGLDMQGRITGIERFQKGKGVGDWNDIGARILELTKDVPTLIDETGVGSPVMDALRLTHSYLFGYIFSSQSKQALMEGLAWSIQRHELTFQDDVVRLELENFEYEYTRTGVRYSAPEGFHDDCVMALGLANEMLKRQYPNRQPLEPSAIERISPVMGVHGFEDEDGYDGFSEGPED